MEDLLLGQDCIRVILSNVTVDVQVGQHAWERHPEHPTRLQISVELFAPVGEGPTSMTPVIDYDPVRRFIVSLAQRAHVDLLETIVDEIVKVCFDDGRVMACRVKALKPDIFNEADGAGVEVFRTRARWSRK
ncbi:MAG TPA: dihydroneopterin aldolase [Xanthobacteraceae bacterium]|nr:dihydroneopterin aldolase [Xanthobacteraceae bacterium]